MDAPIMMTKECWMASQLSVARFAGGCKAWGKEYLVVPQSADLVRTDFLPFYTKLGRDKFLETLRFYPHADEKQLRQHMKNLLAERKSARPDTPKQGDLFGDE